VKFHSPPYFRALNNNHSEPTITTTNPTIILHGVDDVGSSLGVDVVSFVSGAFFGGDGSKFGDDGGGEVLEGTSATTLAGVSPCASHQSICSFFALPETSF
jgi:hypothetical protein